MNLAENPPVLQFRVPGPRCGRWAVVGLLLSPGKRPVVASVETQATSTLRNSDRRTSALIGGIGDDLDPGLR